MSNQSKGRIAKIFDNLKKSDYESTKMDVAHETYVVNSDGSLLLESRTAYSESIQAVTSTITTIEGNPKNILTKNKNMLLYPSESYESRVQVSNTLLDNCNNSLDGQFLRQVTIQADIHEEPYKLSDNLNTTRDTSAYNSDINLDAIHVISSTEVVDQNDMASKTEEHEISPFSPSILISPIDEPSKNALNDVCIKRVYESVSMNDSNNSLDMDLQKRKRKKRPAKETWEKNKNMKLREKGKKYHGRTKEVGVWKYNKTKSERRIKPRCICKLSNKATKLECSKINDEERQNIFEDFWKLTWKEKKIYVKTLVVIKPKVRKRGNQTDSRRNNSLELYLEKNTIKSRVCKTMFLNTLAVGEWALKNWARKKDANQRTAEEKVDKNVTKKQQIMHFFDLLAKLESHYCRKQSSKLYLETTWESKSQLLRYYNEEFCKEYNYDRVSVATFNQVFEEMNLGLFQPKKDACDLCEGYKTKNISEEIYSFHIIKKESARYEKEKDKISEKEVFTMDLQAVQLCPKSNVSSLYFKTKLAVHIFTGYDIKRSEGYSFIWNETEGGLTANEFASIIVRMLELFINKNNIKEGSEIILYTDGCTYQNRNATLSNALLNFAMLKCITIVQKILEKGHTQMEADSMHSVIERQVRKKKINIPADYVQIVKTACKKKPYYVEYLEHKFFKNFETGLNFYKSIRPGKRTGDPVVTDLRQLTYLPEGKIYYRLGFTEDCPELPLPSRIKKIEPRSIEDLSLLYTERLKIKKSKFDHLQQLKLTMESDFHAFYDALPHED